VRQVVGDGNPLAIGRHRGVTGIDAGTHFGDQGHVPQVVFADPAVARGEIDKAALRGKLRPAMQGKAAGKAVDGRQAVAIDQRYMVIAAFDDDKQVHRVGRKGGLVGQSAGVGMDDMRRADGRFIPGRRRRDRGINQSAQGLDLLGAQDFAKSRHLRCQAAFANGFFRLGFFQAAQAFRQQGRTHAAQPVGAVTAGAMLLVEGRCIGQGGGGKEGGKKREQARQQAQAMFHISSSFR